MSITKRIVLLAILMLAINISLATAAVEFYAESSTLNPRVGDAFTITIKLNIPEAEAIKTAAFTLTPGAGISIANGPNRGTSAALLGGSPDLNVAAGNVFQYSETFSDVSHPAVSGNAQTLVTIPVTAAAAGEVAFTFSALQAKKGRTSYLATSTPLRVTIQPGDGNRACAAADWTAGAWGACSQTQCGQAGTQTRTVNKNIGVTCDGEGGKPAVTQACTGTVCEEGACVNGACVQDPKETLRSNLKDKVDDVVDGLNEDQIPANEDDTANFFRFISSLTRSLRELFS